MRNAPATVSGTSRPDEHSAQKRAAAECAADLVVSGMVVGLGTGSTGSIALRGIPARLAAGALSDVIGIPNSTTVARAARQLGIAVGDLAPASSMSDCSAAWSAISWWVPAPGSSTGGQTIMPDATNPTPVRCRPAVPAAADRQPTRRAPAPAAGGGAQADRAGLINPAVLLGEVHFETTTGSPS
ncbi:MAG: hypothetical protein ABI251_12190 [Mycobacteriaceae bacterium]